jgi:hypothetical protein
MTYSFIDVYTITIKKRLIKLFDYLLKGKYLNAFVEVIMSNHIILVAVCYWLLIKLNKFIYMHLYTATIKKSR